MLLIITILISLNFTCITTNESGRTSFILTSESQENQMGKEYYDEVLKESKLSKNKNELEVLGTGEQKRDFIYVDDCVNAFLLAAYDIITVPYHFEYE